VEELRARRPVVRDGYACLFMLRGASVYCFACGGQVISRYRASTVFTWRCVSFPSFQCIASGVADVNIEIKAIEEGILDKADIGI
jgi:hypothetical protein